MCCSGKNHDKEKSPLKRFNDGRFSLCTDGCVDILRIVCGPRSAPDAFHPRQTLSETLNWSVSRVLTNLRRNNAAMSGPGTSRWGWVRGLCCGGGDCRPGAVGGGGGGSGCSTVTEEQWEPHHPHPHGCLCTMYQNATCRIPSVLHSLTVCLPNNRVVWLAGTGQGNSGSLQNKSPALFFIFHDEHKKLKTLLQF